MSPTTSDPGRRSRVFGRDWMALLAVSLAVILTPGCQREAPDGVAETREPTSALTAERADLLAEVMQADRLFAQAVAENGLEAWVAAFAEDGFMIPPSGPVPRGPEAIREVMATAFQVADFSLEWEPTGGAVSGSGDLAYTFGDYESRGGEEAMARGRYVTLWSRGNDGVWRVLADIGNREPSESSEGP